MLYSPVKCIFLQEGDAEENEKDKQDKDTGWLAGNDSDMWNPCEIHDKVKLIKRFIAVLENNQTPTQPSRGKREKHNVLYRYMNFMFNLIMPSRVSSYKPYFFTISFNDWQNLQWQLGSVWFLRTEWHHQEWSYIPTCFSNAHPVKTTGTHCWNFESRTI